MEPFLLRRLLASLVITASLLAPRAALAQDQDVDKKAQSLFAEGLAAKERGDDETACKKFTESFDLSGTVGPLLNLATCEEKRGHPATALARWKRGLVLLQEKSTKDGRIATVQDRIKALEKVVPRLTVKLAPDAPEGTRVRIDGQAIEMPSGPVPVDPGDRTVTVSAPDHEEARITVTVVELDRKEVTVAPGPKREASSGGGGEDGAGGSGGHAGGPAGGDEVVVNKAQRTAGFVIGGLGVAGLGAGLVTGIMALKKHEEFKSVCPQKTDPCPSSSADDPTLAADGKRLALINTITLAAGGGLAVLGTVLILTSGGKKKAPETTGFIAPLPGGAGAVLRTTF